MLDAQIWVRRGGGGEVGGKRRGRGSHPELAAPRRAGFPQGRTSAPPRRPSGLGAAGSWRQTKKIWRSESARQISSWRHRVDFGEKSVAVDFSVRSLKTSGRDNWRCNSWLHELETMIIITDSPEPLTYITSRVKVFKSIDRYCSW